MTKPVTSVAALMLVDEGRIALDEPITRYAPELSHMRVLRSPKVPLNETDPAERTITFGGPLHPPRRIHLRGFGLGVSIVEVTDKTDLMRRGSVGTVSWPGAFGGWWQADPKEGTVLVFLAHNMVDLAQMAKGIGLGVWGAIEIFETLASASRR